MKNYNYGCLEKEIDILKKLYPNTEWGTIGKSVCGKELFYIRLGHGKKAISFNGAHHGMEWITSAMLMRFVKDYLLCEKENKPLGGFLPQKLSQNASLYIIPMVNPDGVELATGGMVEKDMEQINPGSDFRRWQANANGVDLNHNYDALWQKSKSMEQEYGIFIYHGFEGKEPPLSLKIAKAFECVSGYKIDRTQGIASFGGYKDWFVDKLQRPGFTVEVGEGRNPLPIENLPIIYKETLPILLGAMTVV